MPLRAGKTTTQASNCLFHLPAIVMGQIHLFSTAQIACRPIIGFIGFRKYATSRLFHLQEILGITADSAEPLKTGPAFLSRSHSD